MQLSDLPLPIQQAYSKKSELVSDVQQQDNEVGGVTYTVSLTNGRTDTWERPFYWWRLVRQRYPPPPRPVRRRM